MLFLVNPFSASIFAQSTPIAIGWSGGQVGCQVYSQGEPPRGDKDAVFIEDIQDGKCLRVCERRVIVYTLTGVDAGNVVTWTAAGGTVMVQSNTSCTINWGATGSGSIAFSIAIPTGTITKQICIEKIIVPTASFDLLTGGRPDPRLELMSCTNQVLNFTNLSTPNNGTSIISYQWDFGDGTFSSAFEPSHTYIEEGNFTIVLTVTNSCYCSVSIKRKITIRSKGFDIICPGVVCDNQQVTYTLPEEEAYFCQQGFQWTAQGGSVSTNPDTGAATVVWNSVGTGGFGYLTFNPSKCNVNCLVPTTIKVPVIQNKGTIVGNATFCLGSQGRYKLPQWPTTDFKWEIVGNTANSIAEVILTDQRNEVIVKPLVSGPIILRATYTNTLLKCGGSANFVINVTNAVEISGASATCQNTTTGYSNSTQLPVNWTLKNNAGVIVVATVNSATFSYNFPQIGTFQLSVSGGSGACGFADKLITVVAQPVAVAATAISGVFIEVCPDSPYTYSVSNPSSTFQYRWEVDNGSIIGSAIGTQATIKFNTNAPNQIRVYQESVFPVVCSSPATVKAVLLKELKADISSSNGAVCANSIVPYSAIQSGIVPDTAFTQGETFTWSIANPSLGSITTGQGTRVVNVLWNNVTVTTNTTLILTIKSCTLTKVISKPIVIQAVPVISITSAASFCSGATVSFSIDSNIPLNAGTVVTWNFGSGNVTGGTTVSNTFFNVSTTDVGYNVTATISNANGCIGTSNIASKAVTVLPAPPATVSISSGGNVFCTKFEINTILTVATSATAITKQWFKDGIPLSGQVNNTVNCANHGYGNYYFVATNAAGCATTSNGVGIIKKCTEEGNCVLNPIPLATNTSANNCGIISLIGGLSAPPLAQSWDIIGPVSFSNYTNISFAGPAGLYTIFNRGYYQCQNQAMLIVSATKQVVIPYIPDFSYTVNCTNNNLFSITFFDKTNFYSVITSQSVQFSYKLATATTWTTVTGTTAPNLPAGNYQLRVRANGFLPGAGGGTQPQCEKIENVTISPVPLQTLSSSQPPCHDSSVSFNVSFAVGNTYLWTFEPGVTSTLQNSFRVFNSSGTKIVTLRITNKYGCFRDLQTTVVVPPKCFDGVLTASPSPVSVCAGQSVTLKYTPAAGDCAIAQYNWMNGSTPITPSVNSPNLVVSTPGFYWLNVKNSSLNCSFDSPNRITPDFKNPPSIRLNVPPSVCVGLPIVVTAVSDATLLSWSFDGIPQPAAANNPSFTFNGAGMGNHQVSLTATLNGCSSTSTQTIAVLAIPTVSILLPTIVCAPRYLVTLTATSNLPGAVFMWNNGMQGSTISVNSGGPYQVKIISGDCVATATVLVPKNLEEYLWIFPSGCVSDCNNIKTNAFLIGPRLPLPEWNWNFNQEPVSSGFNTFPAPFGISEPASYTFGLNTGTCLAVSRPLDYALTYCEKCDLEAIAFDKIERTNDKFCAFSAVFTAVNNSGSNLSVTIAAPNDNVIVVPSSIVLVPGYNNIPLVLTPVGTVTGGTITLQLNGIDRHGNPCVNEIQFDLPSCDATSQGKNSANKTSSLVTKEATTLLKLVPNPVQSELAINFKTTTQPPTIEIYDLFGRLITSHQPTTAAGVWELSTLNFSAGVYLVVLKENNAVVAQQKLIKQ